VLFFLLIFFLTGISLTVVLWVITLFLQGYYYTEATAGIAWQAPAAGFGLGLFLALWAVLDMNSEGAGPGNLPYDTIFRFSPTVELVQAPVKELWVVKKGVKEPIHYKLKKLQRGGLIKNVYVEAQSGQPYSPNGVQAIVIAEGGEKATFYPAPGPEGSYYRNFVDERGYEMREFEEGPSGIPAAFRWGRFLVNLLLNLTHLGLWFVALSLVLRFEWSHALGLALVLWLVMTLTVLPLILEQAGSRAGPRAARPEAGQPALAGWERTDLTQA
jgi:hypothetical protein